ncbi:hypothetical protein AAU57_13895 [Nonlabens sp. YIK11]|uniref:DUF4153 domain-containing protein n=1 Tax=Nonlabens sp. YIK11 TaxID=1453349 RepID=UPI0006DCDABB|nr:DUF4153 domain-containing protein [Nonlabens sp. YIK11]KQC34309.1 hypothetical protein AAU57_13895 [Nonlabens sp. YIK11]
MKNILSIAGGLLFALLFHDQLLGINVLIFSVFLIIALLVSNKKVAWTWPLTASMIGVVLSAVAIAYHGSTPAKWSYFACIFLFLGYLAYPRASIYISLINGVYNSILGIFHGFLYPSADSQEKSIQKIKYGEWILGIGIPLVLVVVFVSFYSNVNPVFDKWLNTILAEFEYIDFLWFFTASVATFLMLNIIQPNTIEELKQADARQGNLLTPATTIDPSSVKTELRIGTLSLIALNVLLVLVLISEFMFLTHLSDFTAADLSKSVHQGVYSSIASVVVAICLIAFVFRGSINWLKSNQTIKLLAYGWMVLNSFLLVTIAMKTWEYITSYGLTEKRIGVLIYLVLCLIGIITVFIKVQGAFNFAFLMRKNLSWSIAVLAVLGWINWSAVISRYNIKHDFDNTYQLYQHFPQNAFVLKQTNHYEEVTSHDKMRYSKKIDPSHLQDRNWQEFNYTFYKASTYEK